MRAHRKITGPCGDEGQLESNSRIKPSINAPAAGDTNSELIAGPLLRGVADYAAEKVGLCPQLSTKSAKFIRFELSARV
jgi:hypothetical protein